MRNPERIKRICKKLEKLWLQHPDIRLGQLLENYVFTKGKRGKETCFLFYQEDDETELLLDRENIKEK